MTEKQSRQLDIILRKLVTKQSRKYSNDTKIYPNPAETIVNIECRENIENISLHDLTGKTLKILQGIDQSNIQVNIEDLQPGLYLLRVRTQQHEESFMIIKQ